MRRTSGSVRGLAGACAWLLFAGALQACGRSEHGVIHEDAGTSAGDWTYGTPTWSVLSSPASDGTRIFVVMGEREQPKPSSIAEDFATAAGPQPYNVRRVVLVALDLAGKELWLHEICPDQPRPPSGPAVTLDGNVIVSRSDNALDQSGGAHDGARSSAVHAALVFRRTAPRRSGRRLHPLRYCDPPADRGPTSGDPASFSRLDGTTGDPTALVALDPGPTIFGMSAGGTERKLTLSLTVGSGGDDMTASFSGHLSAAPVDSDGDGIVDPLDNCPDVPNPDQVDAPPVIASVSETEIEQCTPSSVLQFPVPTVTDVCTPDEITIEGSVIQINGVVQSPPIFLDGYVGTFPSTYPSGSVLVEWTATDGNGHTTSVTQTFQLRSDHTGPVFDVVPADLTTSKCTGVSLGQAAATDSCGGSVTFSTNAPSKFGLGLTTVTWTATDARGNKRTATQKVTTLLGNDSACCPAGTNIIVGTSTNNVLTGTSGSDCILGLGGQDTLNGNGGDDYLSGGDGNDTLNGGDGNDKLFGGSGQDTLNGNNGSDSMYGGDGDDLLVGGIGDDLMHGGQGQDTLQGQDGNDQLFGDTGHDNLQGGNGDDLLGGDAGGAICDGGTGTNVFEQCDTGAPDSCTDAAKNGSESAVDCGGGCQLGCDVGLACASGGDCLGNVCSGGLCQSVPGGIAVKLIVDTDFVSGYCVRLAVTNAADDPTTDWTASFNTNQSTIYSSWGGTFSSNSGVVTVTLPEEPVLDVAETDASTGFCANRNVPSSGSLPFVLSGLGSY